MRVINIYGQAGAGKSTVASGLFNIIKQESQKSVELIDEFAKTLVWSQRFEELKDQFFVSANQYHKLHILEDKVDLVITDSPILLGAIYKPHKQFRSLTPLLLELDNSMITTNIFLVANTQMKYEKDGRLQTKEEAEKIGERIENMLNKNKIEYTTFLNEPEVHQKIFQWLKLRRIV
ncbi:ATP-binding protein [Candidatus Woesearchaeota archaeon]|nr:ATP-binding protein [Candidatus Woesearchaeota archaeon]